LFWPCFVLKGEIPENKGVYFENKCKLNSRFLRRQILDRSFEE
jgi:hypothetical protein